MRGRTGASRKAFVVDVVSLELCQELYALSSWDDCSFDWLIDKIDDEYAREPAISYLNRRHSEIFDWLPAYDLSYLLTKLPPYLHQRRTGRWSPNLQIFRRANWWTAGYSGRVDLSARARTAADAVAVVTIRLLTQGLIEK
jgi:hypothetical protein